MAVATGNFAELLWPGIAEIWGQTYNDYEPLYSEIFEMKTSDKRFEKEQGVTGLPLAHLKNEGAPVAYVDPYQGFQKEYVNSTYALGSTITREMYEDDQYNYINGIPRMLARSLRQTEETDAFNKLNRAFNASFTGADGQTLCSASHPLVGGGTFSNQLATAADLTMTSFEQALQDIMDFVDDQSLKIRVMPRTLVVATQNVMNARKIVETDKVVGSADNDKNVARGVLSNLVVSPYLSDSDAWFIVTDVPNGLVWYTRREAHPERDNEFDTMNLKFIVSKRWVCSWTDPRGVYGTPGA